MSEVKRIVRPRPHGASLDAQPSQPAQVRNGRPAIGRRQRSRRLAAFIDWFEELMQTHLE